MLFVAEWMALLVLHLLLMMRMTVIVFGDISSILAHSIHVHFVVIVLLLVLSDHILLHFLSLSHLTCFHVVFGDLLTLVILTRLFFLHGL